LKRKLLLLSFTMMSGLPHLVLAKSGEGGHLPQSYTSWEGVYMPHYGSEGVAHPLMDHLSASLAGQNAVPNKWRLEFALPRATRVGASDLPIDRGTRMGLSMKLAF
jgi:hypothetical protein